MRALCSSGQKSDCEDEQYDDAESNNGDDYLVHPIMLDSFVLLFDVVAYGVDICVHSCHIGADQLKFVVEVTVIQRFSMRFTSNLVYNRGGEHTALYCRHHLLHIFETFKMFQGFAEFECISNLRV